MLVLRFMLGGVAHAIDCNDIIEVIPFVDAQPLIGAPAFVRGVFVFRGRPAPIIDLGQLMSAQCSEIAYSSRIIVVRAGDDGEIVGLVADRATDVEQVPQEQLMPAPMHLGEMRWATRVINRPLSDSLTFLVDPRGIMPRDLQSLVSGRRVVS